MTFTGWGRISKRTRWHWFNNGKPMCMSPVLLDSNGDLRIKDLQTILIRWNTTGIKGATLDQRDCCKKCYRLKMEMAP